MENLPGYINWVFAVTALITVAVFLKASGGSRPVLIMISAWLSFQTYMAQSGYYTITHTLPPRFLLLVFPPVVTILLLFMLPRGRRFLDQLHARTLTALHTIRIPVEVVLYGLFVNGTVPEIVTFEGRNFDILVGISAPFIAYFGYVRNSLSRKFLIGWNILSLSLLLNVVIHGALSVPTPFQQFGFDQPNIAMMHFPFVWLPAGIVPLVLLAHLATIRQLIRK